MRTATITNGLHWSILSLCIVLITGCASSQFTTTGTATPILPTAEEISENYNPSLAIGLEKVILGTIRLGGVIHQHLTSISPDGKRIAYAASTDQKKWYMVTENLQTHDLVKGAEFESVYFPTFSPDGTKLAYTALQNGKWFVMIDNDKGFEFDQVSVPSFSPDGSKIAYVAVESGKQFIMINDKKGPEFDLVYSEISFSPDGSKVAYGVKQGSKSFVIVEGKKGPEFDVVALPTFNPMGDKLAYIAVQGDKVFVMVDDKKGPEFDGARRDLIFSPNGRRLAYVAERTEEGKASESLIIVLELHDNGDLTIYKTFGPLDVSVARLQPLTMGNISGIGWSPTFSPDNSNLAYGVNGGASAAVKEPIRTSITGRHYYIESSVGNSTIEIDGNVVANISNTGLVTPLSFSPNGKEISWLLLTKARELYSKKLKLK